MMCVFTYRARPQAEITVGEAGAFHDCRFRLPHPGSSGREWLMYDEELLEALTARRGEGEKVARRAFDTITTSCRALRQLHVRA